MAFKPLFMKDIDLILGGADGTNFKCQLRSVTLTPDTNTVKTKTLCPDGTFAEVETPEWTLDLGYLYGKEDTDALKALARYLLEHQGEKVEFMFRPWTGDDTEGYEGTVTVLPGAIGGDQGSFSEQSVSLPLDGQPKPIGSAPAGLMMAGDAADEF